MGVEGKAGAAGDTLRGPGLCCNAQSGRRSSQHRDLSWNLPGISNLRAEPTVSPKAMCPQLGLNASKMWHVNTELHSRGDRRDGGRGKDKVEGV